MSKSSIMHDKRDGTCYLCMKLHGDYDRRTRLEEHHALMGNQYKKLAENYGLKVYLCPEHHRTSPKEAVHDNQYTDEPKRMLQREAQKAFEKRYSYEEWMRVFGRNFL